MGWCGGKGEKGVPLLRSPEGIQGRRGENKTFQLKWQLRTKGCQVEEREGKVGKEVFYFSDGSVVVMEIVWGVLI